MLYDLEYLSTDLGVSFTPSRYLDVQVLEPILDELQYSYSLDSILRRHGLPGKDEGLLTAFAKSLGVDRKKDLWRMPGRFVGGYATADVTLPLTLVDKQLALIRDQGLEKVTERECKLLPVLLKMRMRGVAVDLDRLEQVDKWALAKESQACAEVSRLTGTAFEVGQVNDKKVLLALLRRDNVTPPRTAPTEKFPEGQESVTSLFLKSLPMDWAKAVIVAKRFNKLRGTFVKSVRAHQVNGRIHCTLRQSVGESEGAGDGDESEGARFGRLSCVDPNLQQQPSKGAQDIGPTWRSIYVPDDGGTWACLDVSQQEPRWAIHYAAAMRCPGASEAVRRYKLDAATDAYQLIGEMAGIDRDKSKMITLALMYGMGGGKLCAQLGLPTREIPGRQGKAITIAGPEGQALMDAFDRAVPFLREVAKLAEQAASRRGWVLTGGGRRCRFPKLGGRYDWTYKAFNRIVQGTSGDQMREAMVQLDAAGYPMQLQVHDEVDFTFNGDVDYLRPAARILCEALPCSVPHKVDLEIGPNWGSLKKVTG
jgi:DNA polymerase I-like protein with 3'-5' exonuclease and polymerase domains